MGPHKPGEAIKCQGYDSKDYNNKYGIEAGNPDPNHDIQGKNAECDDGNGKAHGESDSFQYVNLSEEDQ